VALTPVALALIVLIQLTGTGTLVGHGWIHVLLLMASGPVTASALLLYGSAARRLPLTTLGTLLYVTPTLQFLWGVLVVGEAMPVARWVGFRDGLGGAGHLHRRPGAGRPPARCAHRRASRAHLTNTALRSRAAVFRASELHYGSEVRCGERGRTGAGRQPVRSTT
jgi:hypothetical protein